jgi:hypothetical protein
MTRAITLMVLGFLTITPFFLGIACETRHVDQNFGTDAGAGFDAPAREVHPDGGDAGDGEAAGGPAHLGGTSTLVAD